MSFWQKLEHTVFGLSVFCLWHKNFNIGHNIWSLITSYLIGMQTKNFSNDTKFNDLRTMTVIIIRRVNPFHFVVSSGIPVSQTHLATFYSIWTNHAVLNHVFISAFDQNLHHIITTLVGLFWWSSIVVPGGTHHGNRAFNVLYMYKLKYTYIVHDTL